MAEDATDAHIWLANKEVSFVLPKEPNQYSSPCDIYEELRVKFFFNET